MFILTIGPANRLKKKCLKSNAIQELIKSMVEKVLGSWNPFQIFQELKVFINFDPQKKIEYFYFLAFLSIRKSRCGKIVRLILIIASIHLMLWLNQCPQLPANAFAIKLKSRKNWGRCDLHCMQHFLNHSIPQSLSCLSFFFFRLRRQKIILILYHSGRVIKKNFELFL